MLNPEMQLLFLLVTGVPSPTPTPGTLKTLNIQEWGVRGGGKEYKKGGRVLSIKV